MYIPEIEDIVLESCAQLIKQYNFYLSKIAKNKVELISERCGIKVVAGISPIGEPQIEIDFFDPLENEAKRRYFNNTFLLYINTRSEPSDVIDKCLKEYVRTEGTFEETIRIALTCFTAHTLKYRTDILNGDFTSWLPRKV